MQSSARCQLRTTTMFRYLIHRRFSFAFSECCSKERQQRGHHRLIANNNDTSNNSSSDSKRASYKLNRAANRRRAASHRHSRTASASERRSGRLEHERQQHHVRSQQRSALAPPSAATAAADRIASRLQTDVNDRRRSVDAQHYGAHRKRHETNATVCHRLVHDDGALQAAAAVRTNRGSERRR